MEIILGKTAGFCFGVTNAVTKTKEKLEQTKGQVYCLGELTHNAQVMEELESLGLKVVENINELNENDKVIIRAHGVNPEVYNTANKKSIELLDLTCPKVLNIHKKAEEYAKQNKYIILIAESSHPETIGTYGFCGENCSIIQSIDEIEKTMKKFIDSRCNSIAILSQTTFSMEKFDKIVEEIKKEIKPNIELIIDKTICNATKLRQEETIELSKKVDAMIIIGGKNSANTRKLYDIANSFCKKAIWIQTKEQLEMKELKDCETIGIMAGASTPKKSIEEVINKISNNKEM